MINPSFSDDPYEKDFQPHKEPGPPYYSIYEYTYDNEELYPTYTEYEDGQAYTFDTKNMMNSNPHYSDYFEDEVDDEEYQFMQPETDQRLTTDAPQMPVLELVNAENNSNGLQEDKKIVRPENTSRRANDQEVNRTSLILEPGLDHYPHNAYRYQEIEN